VGLEKYLLHQVIELVVSAEESEPDGRHIVRVASEDRVEIEGFLLRAAVDHPQERDGLTGEGGPGVGHGRAGLI
jgi:hypothetical protein